MSKEALIRIENTEARLITIPTFRDDQNKEIKGFAFSPGGNNVPRTTWDAALAHPGGVGKSLAQWLEVGWLKVDSSPNATKKKPGVEVKSLLTYSPSTAKAIIEDETDPAELLKWGKVERRPEVTAAIEAQYAKVAK